MTSTNPTRGRFFRDHGLALKKAGHQIGMLVPPSRFRTFHGLREFTRYWRQPNTAITIKQGAGITTYRIPWWGWRGSVIPQARGPLALQIFDRYCRERGCPDVIHAYSVLYGGYLAARIKQQRRIPVVLTEYSSTLIAGPLLPGQPRIIRQTLPHIDKLLALGPSLAEAMQAFVPGRKVEVLGNVVDTAYFVPLQTPLSLSPFIFALVANLDRNKGVDVLLDAFKVFRGQSVRLRIAGGDRGQRSKLERLADELGLSTQIEFLGMQSREQVRDLLQQSHAVVSSSYTETFGVTLTEAMACGKPVVATRSGGPQSFVTPETGLLVPPGDSEALGAAMQRLMQTYEQYDPDRIRAWCVEKFSEESVVAHLETIYQSLVSAS